MRYPVAVTLGGSMPRRHRREQHEPLNLKPEDIPPAPRPRSRTWVAQEEWEAQQEIRDRLYAERRQAREQAARRKRVQEAINWDFCIVAGCLAPIRIPDYQRDVDMRLPVCDFHSVVIKRQLEPYWDDDKVVTERMKVQKHREQVRDANDRSQTISINGGHSKGQIYFLRLNGLVKVGWSSNLIKRFKAYGPDVEILCHYPASRQDETLMHRQLRPYLAKGREWYHDVPLIADVVAQLIKQHGAPKLSANWTEPKPDPIKLHRKSA